MGSGDMYAKGANMLHTLRQLIGDDELWRSVLRGLNEEFYHQTVKTEQVEAYITDRSGFDLELFFDQYLRDTRIPTFEYALVDGEMRYRLGNCVEGFNMKLKVLVNGEPRWIEPRQDWQNLSAGEGIREVEVDEDFYVAVFPLTEI
jgi:hypothetical protein